MINSLQREITWINVCFKICKQCINSLLRKGWRNGCFLNCRWEVLTNPSFLEGNWVVSINIIKGGNQTSASIFKIYLRSDHFSTPTAISLIQAPIILSFLKQPPSWSHYFHPWPFRLYSRSSQITSHPLSHPPMVSHPIWIKAKTFYCPLLPFSWVHKTSPSPLGWFPCNQISLPAVSELTRNASVSGRCTWHLLILESLYALCPTSAPSSPTSSLFSKPSSQWGFLASLLNVEMFPHFPFPFTA